VMIAVDPVVSYPLMIAYIDRFLICLPGFNSLFGLAELNTVSRNLSILVLELDRDMCYAQYLRMGIVYFFYEFKFVDLIGVCCLIWGKNHYCDNGKQRKR